MTLIDIWSGNRFEPGFYSAGQSRWWSRSELKKDGTPDARCRGRLVGVTWSVSGIYYNGQTAIVDENRELVAAPLRARVAALQAELEAARAALVTVYAGPKPVSQNQ